MDKCVFPPGPRGATAHSGPGPPQCRPFTITLRHTTLGRAPLYEWSACRRDFHLTTHNTHKRQTSMPPPGFEPAIPASECPQNHLKPRGQWDRLTVELVLNTAWEQIRNYKVWKQTISARVTLWFWTSPSLGLWDSPFPNRRSDNGSYCMIQISSSVTIFPRLSGFSMNALEMLVMH
jgi:hypothetical protein